MEMPLKTTSADRSHLSVVSFDALFSPSLSLSSDKENNLNKQTEALTMSPLSVVSCDELPCVQGAQQPYTSSSRELPPRGAVQHPSPPRPSMIARASTGGYEHFVEKFKGRVNQGMRVVGRRVTPKPAEDAAREEEEDTFTRVDQKSLEVIQGAVAEAKAGVRAEDVTPSGLKLPPTGAADTGRPSTGGDEQHKNNEKKKSKKSVRFPKDEDLVQVHPIHFDWSRVDDVFFTREEIGAMKKRRMEDADTLRSEQQQHNTPRQPEEAGAPPASKAGDIAALLAAAFERDNRDESAVSIRGIEPFVYADLREEMIRRKRLQRGQVLELARGGRPGKGRAEFGGGGARRREAEAGDLAERSSAFSAWARTIALQKGMEYRVNGLSAEGQRSVHRGVANMDTAHRPPRRKK